MERVASQEWRPWVLSMGVLLMAVKPQETGPAVLQFMWAVRRCLLDRHLARWRGDQALNWLDFFFPVVLMVPLLWFYREREPGVALQSQSSAAR